MRYAEDLAYVHHTGFADLARGASPFLLALLADHGPCDVVDLGCGSGIVLRALADAGHRAIGVDLSPAMLAIANKTAPAATLVLSSLYDATLPACDAVFAVGEPLNYVEKNGRAPAVAPLFRRVAQALRPDGLLVFDVIVAGKPSLHKRGYMAGDDWAVLVDTSDEGAVITRDVTTFVKRGADYARSRELHRVRVFDTRALASQLRAAGFSVRVTTSYGAHPLAVRRRAFVCTKTAPKKKPPRTSPK